MNTKTRRIMLLSLAALFLPFGWADAAVSLQFNSSASPPAIVVDLATTNTVTFTLRLVATGSEHIQSLDYFLFQTAGPAGSNPFSISSTGRTTSDFPDPNANEAQVTSSSDVNNATGGTGADGRPDNLLKPNNEWDLGANTTSGFYTGGTHPVGTYTLTIAGGAALGTYTIMTGETIQGAGWNDEMGNPTAFDSQATIDITLIPEPATWSLIALGGLGALGVSLLRRRKS